MAKTPQSKRNGNGSSILALYVGGVRIRRRVVLSSDTRVMCIPTLSTGCHACPVLTQSLHLLRNPTPFQEWFIRPRKGKGSPDGSKGSWNAHCSDAQRITGSQEIINGINLVDIWSVQCGKCFNWRLIPTEEEFEEIRSKITVDPFICSKIPNVTCDDPADIERDKSRTWVIHKPDVPKTPVGFKRTLIMRKDFSKMDCYYEAPNGKRFRSASDVSKFLDNFPKYKKDISTADFSFTSPKIMDDTIPAAVGKKVVIKQRTKV